MRTRVEPSSPTPEHVGEPAVLPAPSVPSPAPRRAWGTSRWLALAAAAAALPYLNALTASFTFDDFGLVLQNPKATPGMSPLAWFVRESTTGSLYRPLTMVTFALTERMAPAPWAFHAGNVVLHVLATLAAFDLARLLLRSTPAAAATALVFAVHPVHTEAVTSVAGRSEILAGLFVMLALSGSIRAQRASAGGAGWTVSSVAAFALGFLSKESAFSLLPLLVLVTLWIGPPRAGRVLRALVPYLVVGAACLALRHAVVGSFTLAEPPPFIDNPLAHTGGFSRIATAVVVLLEYVSVLAVPLRLSADESFNQVRVVVSALDVRLLAAVGLFATVGAALVVERRRVPVLGLAALFFAAAMTVTANVVFPIGTVKAERLLYLPSFGWCLACGWLLRRWTGRTVGPRLAAAALALLLLAGRTWARNEDWRDDYTLFTRTAQTSPNSARAHGNAGALYGQKGELAPAAEHFRAALAIDPTFAPAAMGLAQVHDMRGERDEAIRWYREAVRLDPHATRGWIRAGDLLLRAGDSAGAVDLLRAGRIQVGDDPFLLVTLAVAVRAQGGDAEAERLLTRAMVVGGLSPDVARLVEQARAPKPPVPAALR